MTTEGYQSYVSQLSLLLRISNSGTTIRKTERGDGTEINSVQRWGCYQDAGDVGMLNSRGHGQECVLQPSDGIPGGKKRFVDERAWPQKLWSPLTLPLQLPTPLLPPLTSTPVVHTISWVASLLSDYSQNLSESDLLWLSLSHTLAAFSLAAFSLAALARQLSLAARWGLPEPFLQLDDGPIPASPPPPSPVAPSVS